MASLAIGQSSSCENPELDIFAQVSGVLTNLFLAEYQIWDLTGASPVQVYPATLGDRALVNVDEDCPTGDRLGTGHYVANWTVPVDEPVGTHEVRWFFKLLLSSQEQTFAEEFEVIDEVVVTSDLGYCVVSDLREEGVTTSMASDARLRRIIARATQMIDLFTGRSFLPKTKTFRVDGTGHRILQLNEPIISISSVKIDTFWDLTGDTEVDTDLYRVFNRHLSQGLLSPDDRENPKLEFWHASDLLGVHSEGGEVLTRNLIWPEGAQNVEVSGVFGYTDPDGSPTGKTPDMIRHACKLLVMRELPQLANTGARDDAQNRWRLISERTRDQEYQRGPSRALGTNLIGDPEIEAILSQYVRPMNLGAV